MTHDTIISIQKGEDRSISISHKGEPYIPDSQAKAQSIAFAEWIHRRKWKYSDVVKVWFQPSQFETEYFKTSDLFDLFKEQQL